MIKHITMTTGDNMRLYITLLVALYCAILGVLATTQGPDPTTAAAAPGPTPTPSPGGGDNSEGDSDGTGIDKSSSEPDDVVYDAKGAIYIGIAFFSVVGALVLILCLCDIPSLARHVKYAQKNINHGKNAIKSKTKGKSNANPGDEEVNADSMERLVTSPRAASPRSTQVAPI